MLDRDALVAPITADEPSGALLEYDPAFLALAEAARGKPEQRMGDAVIAGEPPDWGAVERGAVALLARTKDLRVAALLARARLHGAGIAGLAEGLAFVRALLEEHWDTVHPQLEADDANDPAMRINALSELSGADAVLALRNAEVAAVRALGRIRVRDLEPAQGGNGAAAAPAEAAGEKEKPPPVDVVLARCEREALASTLAAAEAAAEAARAIEAFVRERAGSGPNLGALTALLDRVAAVLGPRVGRAAPDGGESGAATAGVRALPGAIGSRDDVVAALDGIAAFYERFEPSSPIPLLVRRTKRLVSKTFIDIVRDVMPEALAQAEGLRGRSDAGDEDAGGPSSQGGERT